MLIPKIWRNNLTPDINLTCVKGWTLGMSKRLEFQPKMLSNYKGKLRSWGNNKSWPENRRSCAQISGCWDKSCRCRHSWWRTNQNFSHRTTSPLNLMLFTIGVVSPGSMPQRYAPQGRTQGWREMLVKLERVVTQLDPNIRGVTLTRHLYYNISLVW